MAGRTQIKTENLNRLRRLDSVNREALKGLDAVNYDTVAYSMRLQANFDRGFDYGDGAIPYVLSQLTGSFLDSQHAIETKIDAEAYLRGWRPLRRSWIRRLKKPASTPLTA